MTPPTIAPQTQDLAPLIWSISDLLRGTYKPIEYKKVILPMTILRRMDCVMEPKTGSPRSSAKPRYSNTSGMSFQALLDDPTNLRENLHLFVNGFTPEMADIFTKYAFGAEIEKLAAAGLLGEVVKRFARVDLDPTVVSNTRMGDLFEALIRAANTDSPGEDFTPRDAVHLLVDLLLAPHADDIRTRNVVRSVYDPTAGTGGLLTVTEERFHQLNPKARLRLFGQEINDESYAICKSDVGSKGGEVGNIQQGNTLTDDKHEGTRFHYAASNPPYGVDWKAYRAEVEEEAARGAAGRFPAGLPRVSDGQMLFLQHVVAKLKRRDEGGGRGCIVMSGSPLFNGAAGSGESEIRRWLLENDLVDAIVALPPGLFANTGIGTYIWVLDNVKEERRRGRVQLLDAREVFTKMRKNVGMKNREMTPADRKRVLDAYEAFDQADPDISKIFTNDDFGYWTITVERPLLDENGSPVTDRKGNAKPDTKARDTENVPFGYGDQTDQDACIKAYMEAEVLPYYPDAWADQSKTKIGFEIPFTRHFYRYVAPRPLADIDADLNAIAADIMAALKKIEAA